MKRAAQLIEEHWSPQNQRDRLAEHLADLLKSFSAPECRTALADAITQLTKAKKGT